MQKFAYSVITAKAGIQNPLRIPDSGSNFALSTLRCRASLARNDNFPPVFESFERTSFVFLISDT